MVLNCLDQFSKVPQSFKVIWKVEAFKTQDQNISSQVLLTNHIAFLHLKVSSENLILHQDNIRYIFFWQATITHCDIFVGGSLTKWFRVLVL